MADVVTGRTFSPPADRPNSQAMNPLVFEGVLAAAQEAEEWAWTAMYEWLSPQLGSYFRVRGSTEPDDQVGEVFLQVARNLRSFEGSVEGFRSWVFMIAHNRLANERRRSSRKPIALHADVTELDRDWSPSAESEALDLLDDRVSRLLEHLTLDQRSVIALRLVADISLEETARIMGRSIGSVKQLQRRAIEALRSQLVEEA